MDEVVRQLMEEEIDEKWLIETVGEDEAKQLIKEELSRRKELNGKQTDEYEFECSQCVDRLCRLTMEMVSEPIPGKCQMGIEYPIWKNVS